MGYRIVEVPIRFVYRRVGESKMSSGIVFEAMGVDLKAAAVGHGGRKAPAANYSKLPPS